MRLKSRIIGAVSVFAIVTGEVASPYAATFTFSFSPSIQVVAACEVETLRNLNFGTRGVLSANRNRRARIRVRCSSGVAYDIGLDAGTTAGGTTTTRKMANGGETVDYQMFRNRARTRNWGNNVGVDTVSRTGNGNWQRRWIYGRVPPQSTPSAGTYTDVVTVTVTY